MGDVVILLLLLLAAAAAAIVPTTTAVSVVAIAMTLTSTGTPTTTMAKKATASAVTVATTQLCLVRGVKAKGILALKPTEIQEQPWNAERDKVTPKRSQGRSEAALLQGR